MQVFHTPRESTSVVDGVMSRLQLGVDALCAGDEQVAEFERFEQKLHALFVAAEREVLAEGLSRLDVEVPFVELAGERHYRVLRSTETYTSAVGPVSVMRTLYRSAKARAVVPVELRAGIVEGHWTPLAAKQAAWVVAHLTPGEGEALFGQLGNMRPSKSSLDRLPKGLSRHWEESRAQFEASLRAQETVPAQAATVTVSLDGVMTPMADGQRQAKREQAREDGKRAQGPAGYQEVGCGTLSFHDAAGQRLSTIRLARMPESKKVTLKSQLSAELSHVLAQRSDLTVVKVADGAKDNWTYLSKEVPAGTELVDFFHAAEHLKKAFDTAYGENTPKAMAQFRKYRHILRHEESGVEKVIRALAYLHQCHPRRTKLTTELGYFRGHRHRMQYAAAKQKNLPIGSGVVEAACKTLATQRLKRSGMRWRHEGGQAILTFRALAQSERFDRAWSLLSETYKTPVSWPANTGLPPQAIAA